jgi:AcrR family transcriptional regulator
MPRDASDTRARILDAAEELFAARGIFAVATSEIVTAAGQRNASAVTYHFGSREELLRALLVERDAPIDAERARLLAVLGPEPSARELLEVLVIPYLACLGDHHGRNYLQIIDQVRDGFSEWRSVPRSAQPNLGQALELLEERMDGLGAEIPQERLIGMMMLMTASAAVRARSIEAGDDPSLDAVAYTQNLIAMLAGVIEAPLAAAANERNK